MSHTVLQHHLISHTHGSVPLVPAEALVLKFDWDGDLALQQRPPGYIKITKSTSTQFSKPLLDNVRG